MDQLRHPEELAALSAPLGRPLMRRDAPFGRARPQAPRALPTSPTDIADFILDVGAKRVAGPGPCSHAPSRLGRAWGAGWRAGGRGSSP